MPASRQKNMRILLFIDSLGPGGAQRQFVGLATMLRHEGNSVKVITYHDINFFLPDLGDISYEYLQDNGNFFRRILNVRHAIKDFRPDWVISFLNSPNIITCLVKLSGIKFKLLVGERSSTQVLTRKERIKFWLYRYADCIVSNSHTQKKYIDTHYPQYSDKSYAISNFVDLEKFRCIDKHQLHPCKPRSTENTILVVGSIRPVKNVFRMIETARIMKERGIRFVIKWFGITLEKSSKHVRMSTPSNIYLKECQRLIAGYGLKQHFQLLEQTNNIEKEYKSADYFCLPSLFEGTPNVLCEALASGLPATCSNICDNPHYVKEKRNGTLFNPLDIYDMANAITRLLSISDEKYYAYSQRSREIAEERFAKEKFFCQYKKLLTNTI